MSYGIEWTAGPVVLGGALLLLLVPGFALIAVVILALAAVAAVIALAGAILASPYLIVRTLRRRHAARHQADEESLPAPNRRRSHRPRELTTAFNRVRFIKEVTEDPQVG